MLVKLLVFYANLYWALAQECSSLPSQFDYVIDSFEADSSLYKSLSKLVPSSPVANSDTAFTYTFDFESTDGVSDWDDTSYCYEEWVFLNQLEHADDNPDHAWKLKIGRGGQIVSFIGETVGETVPPQYHDGAPWIDEVWQQVSVNINQDGVDSGFLEGESDPRPQFIHNAGGYMTNKKDGDATKWLFDKPFYSPALSLYCDNDENSCTYTNWGQQAHYVYNSDHPELPAMIYQNDVLFTLKVRDLDDGIIEINSINYNFGEHGYNYLNTPWGGPRLSTYPNFFRTFADGSEPELFTDFDFIMNLVDTAGYGIYVDNYKTDMEWITPEAMGTVTVNGAMSSRVQNGVLQIIVPIVNEGTHIPDTSSGGVSIWSDGSIILQLSKVAHWAWQGAKMYLEPDTDLTVDEMKNLFYVGQVLEFSTPSFDTELEDAQALGVVFGVDHQWSEQLTLRNSWIQQGQSIMPYGKTPEQADAILETVDPDLFQWAETRLRLWHAGGSARDYSVWSLNPRVWVRPNGAFWFRYYYVMGTFAEVKEKCESLVEHSDYGILDLDGTDTEPIYLYTENGQYKATSDEMTDAICTGQNIPSTTHKPLFLVQYEDGTEVASFDPYILHRVIDQPYDLFRPIDNVNIYQEFKSLLGYFEEDCTTLMEEAKNCPEGEIYNDATWACDAVYGEWSAFSTCTHTCGPQGTQTRTKACLLDTPEACIAAAPTVVYSETVACNTEITCDVCVDLTKTECKNSEYSFCRWTNKNGCYTELDCLGKWDTCVVETCYQSYKVMHPVSDGGQPCKNEGKSRVCKDTSDCTTTPHACNYLTKENKCIKSAEGCTWSAEDGLCNPVTQCSEYAKKAQCKDNIAGLNSVCQWKNSVCSEFDCSTKNKESKCENVGCVWVEDACTASF